MHSPQIIKFAQNIDYKKFGIILSYTFLACFVTNCLVHYTFLPGVLSSSIIALIGSFLKPKEFNPHGLILSASFLGISTHLLPHQYDKIIILSIVGSIIYSTTLHWFTGHGGKMGLLAFVTAFFLSESWIVIHNNIIQFNFAELIIDYDFFALVFLSLFSAVGTRFLNIRYHFSPVRSSGLITLIFGILFFLFEPRHTENTLALIQGATFVGMSRPQNFHHVWLIVATCIYFFIYIIFSSLIKGIGGYLGTMAFISYCFISIWIWITSDAKNKNQNKNYKNKVSEDESSLRRK